MEGADVLFPTPKRGNSALPAADLSTDGQDTILRSSLNTMIDTVATIFNSISPSLGALPNLPSLADLADVASLTSLHGTLAASIDPSNPNSSNPTIPVLSEEDLLASQLAEADQRSKLLHTPDTQGNLRSLADLITSGAYVLFVTGAGISVPSGIKPYRNSPDGLWNNYVTEWGTRKMFLQDPKRWWNEFWFKAHDIDSFMSAQPCPCHTAIANIMRKYSNVRLITQNVDRLHVKAGIDPNRFVEAHGAVGVYRCCNRSCEYSHSKVLENIEFKRDAEGLVIPPHCPECSGLVLPMALLFDESYKTHTFFQYDRILNWLDLTEVIVFCGTSMSVGLTNEVIGRACQYGFVPLYNFNLEPAKSKQMCLTTTFSNVVAPCEISLPILSEYCNADTLPPEEKKCCIM